LPVGDATLEIGTLDAGATEHGGDALANLVFVFAVNHNRPAGRQFAQPLRNKFRSAMDRADDQPIGDVKCLLAPNVDEHRR
jgi:hypothetical protein